jgi:NitT/TauT family transport system permease protein
MASIDAEHELTDPWIREPAKRRARDHGLTKRLIAAGGWIGPIAAFFLVWETIVRLNLASPALLSPPSEVFPTIWRYFSGDMPSYSGGSIWPHLGASLRRGITGFALAVAVGLPLGLLLGWARRASGVISPVVELLRQLPPLAMLPIFILFLGLGFKAQVAMVFWAALWPILLNTVAGTQGVDPRLVKAARTLGATSHSLMRKVVLPSALPTIVTGMRLAASYSLLVLISAEMIGANKGLGFLILNNEYTFHIPEMYAAILILAAAGLTLNYILLIVERTLIPWKQHI